MYLGFKGGVSLANGEEFIALEGKVRSIDAWKDKLYILYCVKVAKEYKWSVMVYDLTGKMITSWVHSDIPKALPNKLCVFDEHVFVPSRLYFKINVYTLTGSLVSYFTCSSMKSRDVMDLVAVSDKLIVSMSLSQTVVCISRTSDQSIIWSKNISGVMAVTADPDTHLVFAAVPTRGVYVLNINTGRPAFSVTKHISS